MKKSINLNTAIVITLVFWGILQVVNLTYFI
jgi:hypothetical protein